MIDKCNADGLSKDLDKMDEYLVRVDTTLPYKDLPLNKADDEILLTPVKIPVKKCSSCSSNSVKTPERALVHVLSAEMKGKEEKRREMMARRIVRKTNGVKSGQLFTFENVTENKRQVKERADAADAAKKGE